MQVFNHSKNDKLLTIVRIRTYLYLLNRFRNHTGPTRTDHHYGERNDSHISP